jgi:hypothetical protein
MTKIAGSGSISQRHGSAEIHPKMSCIRNSGWRGEGLLYCTGGVGGGGGAVR